MSTMEEMAAEYRLAAAKMRLQLQRMEERGARLQDIKQCRHILAELRDTSRLLSGYYDTPRISKNAAVGWCASAKASEKYDH